MNKNKSERQQFDSHNIPLEGSLGLLALGDIGFVAWREIKKKSNKNQLDDK